MTGSAGLCCNSLSAIGSSGCEVVAITFCLPNSSTVIIPYPQLIPGLCFGISPCALKIMSVIILSFMSISV